MPVIYPAPGETEKLARVLLSLVDDPHSIGVANEGGIGFVVTAEVEQLWLDSLRPPEPEPVVVEEPPAAPEPTAPRKNRK